MHSNVPESHLREQCPTGGSGPGADGPAFPLFLHLRVLAHESLEAGFEAYKFPYLAKKKDEV